MYVHTSSYMSVLSIFPLFDSPNNARRRSSIVRRLLFVSSYVFLANNVQSYYLQIISIKLQYTAISNMIGYGIHPCCSLLTTGP
jgi:hypothetical protein